MRKFVFSNSIGLDGFELAVKIVCITNKTLRHALFCPLLGALGVNCTKNPEPSPCNFVSFSCLVLVPPPPLLYIYAS